MKPYSHVMNFTIEAMFNKSTTNIPTKIFIFVLPQNNDIAWQQCMLEEGSAS